MDREDAARSELEEAIARGDFDDLPGAGKPLDLRDAHDPDWWIHRRLRTDDVDPDALLPMVLLLRREHERLPETLAALTDESLVRQHLEDYNRRVIDDRLEHRFSRVLAPTVDVQQRLATWRETRAVPTAASMPGTGGDMGAGDEGPAEPAARRAWLVDRTDRRRALQLVLGVVLFLVVEVVMALVSVGVTMAQRGEFSAGLSGAGELAGACLGAAAATGGYLVIVGPLGRRAGLALRGRGKLAEFALGLGIGTGLIALSVGIIALLGGYRVIGLAPHPELLAPLGLGIGAAFVEEIFFRGILLRVLDAWAGSGVALVVTSLAFGLLHLPNPGASPASAAGLVIEAGVLLAAAYLLTRRLWLAIGIHLAWNTVQSGIFSSPVSGTGERQGILAAQWEGPAWLTGGSMGVEGSLVTVAVGLAAGIVLLVLAHRRGRLLPSVRRERRRTAPRVP